MIRIALALVLLAGVAHAGPPKRADFAKTLSTVKVGMTADQVKKILGPPDDIKTENDPGGITAARTTEIWRYGTTGHLSFATLGAVHIQADRKVQYVFGGGQPSAAIVQIVEADLRKYLVALAAVPSYNDTLDPSALIRAVNTLQPLGKDRALEVISEFLRVSSSLDDPGREGVFLVLRTLFDTTGAAPPMAVGSPTSAPKDPKLLPRFPMIIVDDIPLKLITGYFLAGLPERPEDDVKAYAKAGTIRAKPLAPSVKSLDAIETYLASIVAPVLPGTDDNLRAYVYDQALHLFGTVYRPGNMTVDSWFPDVKDVALRWRNVRAEIAKVAATWDATDMRFVLPNKQTLAPLVTSYPRVWWDVMLPNATKSRLTFERLDDKLVLVEWRVEVVSGKVIRKDTITIRDATTKKLVADLPFEDLANTSVSTRRIALPRGTAIIPELDGAFGPKLVP